MNFTRTSLIVITLLIAGTVAAFAGLPQTISYQGYVKNGTTPVNGTPSMTFSLYSSNPARSNPVWQEKDKQVTVTNGIYSTQLGSTTPITAPFDVPYWLGVNIDNTGELPLQPLSSTGYAFRAGVAATIPDGAVTDSKISGPISASKIPDLAGLQSSIATLLDTVNTLQSTVTTQQSVISGLQTTVNSQQGVINGLELKIITLAQPPEVSLGFNQYTAPDTQVLLYGSINNLKLYQNLSRSWSIDSKPVGSTAQLSSTETTVVTFKPDLPGSYHFRLTISDGINSISSDTTLFVTAPGGMLGRAQLIESGSTNTSSPDVAMDGSGNGVAVWIQNDGLATGLWASRFTRDSGWSTPKPLVSPLGNNHAYNANTPQVAMDRSGNAMVVWQQYDGARDSIYAIHYSSTTNLWGAVQPIENAAGFAKSPQVAMDGSGNAVAVWIQYDGTAYSAYANRYSSATGLWDTAKPIEAISDGVNFLQVAMDGSGTAVAVWQQYDGTAISIYANRYNNVLDKWDTAQMIENTTGDAGYPMVAMDGSGNAVAVWSQYDGTAYSVYTNRYSSATNLWGAAQPIENAAGFAQSPQVAMDGSGNAVAVWIQYDGTAYSAYANRYSSATGLWDTAKPIEAISGVVGYPQVAMDGSGNAVAIWQQHDGTANSIYANRYNNVLDKWDTAQLIESTNGNADSPQIAMDSSGYAIAVWPQLDGTANSIYVNLLSLGWMAALPLENGNAIAEAINPQVAMDGSGNAVAVWIQYDSTSYSVYANRYNSTTGVWGMAQIIESGSGNADSQQVAIDSSGNAVAVWRQYDGTDYNIYANRFNQATGLWGTAQPIEADSGFANSPQVAIDSSGNAVAVWQQYDGTDYSIYANRFNQATGLWGTAQPIEADSGFASSPQVAIDGSDNAMVVWQQYDGTDYSIYANRYNTSGLWDGAQRIENASGAASSPMVAMDGSGNAVAVWIQDDGTANSVYANRYSSSTGIWDTAKHIENATGWAFTPQVAIDGSGNAVAVWQQYDGTDYSIYANRYNNTSGLWDAAQMIENASGAASAPRVAMDDSGNTVTAWIQYDGTRNRVWANRFTPGSGWGSALTVDSNNFLGSGASNASVAIDPAGRPLVVWAQSNGVRNRILATRPWK